MMDGDNPQPTHLNLLEKNNFSSSVLDQPKNCFFDRGMSFLQPKQIQTVQEITEQVKQLIVFLGGVRDDSIA